MGEVIETKAGIQFKEMCEKFIARELSAKDFARQYLDLWDGEYDQISDWEYNTYLDDLIMSCPSLCMSRIPTYTKQKKKTGF